MDIVLGLFFILVLPVLTYLAGCWRTNRKHARQFQPATCESCKDPFGHHDPVTGHCHAEHEREVWVDGSKSHYEWVPCTCRRYIGLAPLDTADLLNTPLPTPRITSTTEQENPR